MPLLFILDEAMYNISRVLPDSVNEYCILGVRYSFVISTRPALCVVTKVSSVVLCRVHGKIPIGQTDRQML